MVKQKLNAFSLIEATISMLIMMLIGTGMLVVLTKQATPQEAYTLKGQYGCWYDEHNQLVEQYFDERTPRTSAPIPVPDGERCQLKLDKRPGHFYILASGAGSNNTHGQVTTIYTNTLSNILNIEVGKAGINSSVDKRTTKILNANSDHVEITAKGGEDVDNGLIPSNIKSCKLVSAGGFCPNGIGKQEDCEIVYTQTYKGIRNKVRINGCSSEDEYGYGIPDNIIDFQDLTITNAGSGGVNLMNINEEDIIYYSSSNNRLYTDKDGKYKMNFELWDSSYLAPDSILGFNGNIRHNLKKESKMSKMLESISSRRQSELTKTLSNLKPGSPQNNGAVLILW